MNWNWLVLGVTGITISACTNAAQVALGIIAPTAASGYATVASDLSDPSETRTVTAQIQNLDWAGSGMSSQREVTVTVSATGNVDEFVVTYQGIPVTLNWNAVEGRYEGINLGLEVWVFPWFESNNLQVRLSWINLFDNVGTIDAYGLAVSGFNSDPTVVAGRTGTATFTGDGGVSLNAQDDSFWTSADGVAVLMADFGTSTISGTIDLTNCSSCGYGGVTIANTTVTLNPTAITANSFAGSVGLTPADFGLQSIGAVGYDGMFYEANATAVGGYFSGVGTALGSGMTTFLNGAFAAGE